MIDFAQARRNMIDSQIRPCDVSDPLVLEALFSIPRERFVAVGREAFAYLDQNIVISKTSDRHLLQPMIVSRMLQALDLLPGEKVLDVACGYGYSSALMASIGATVVALEESEELAQGARERMASHKTVSVITGDLTSGAPQHAPFDAIIINGAIEVNPDKLLAQLKDGGRLVAIHHMDRVSRVLLHTRSGNAFSTKEIIDVMAPVLKAFRKGDTFVF